MKGSYIGKPAGGKLLRLDLEWEDGLVASVAIRGDFFAHPEEGFEDAEAALVGTSVDDVGETFAAGLSSRGVTLFGLTAADIGAAAASIVASSGAKGTFS
ncbi:MAG: hypothetical protein CVV51_10115 [Spirochaetae bacterium HGW-Spirochaetae-7]|jgi:hypothetical protein|nr:MAG: hypothetical protein CVV51_10115 [Spirochaetae bacterium HGW-Spirochaetae-7]